MVPVVYEKIPSLCASCGVVAGHPLDRCSTITSSTTGTGPTAAATSRSRRATSVWSLGLGSRRSSSMNKEAQQQQQTLPVSDTDKNDYSAGSSSASSSLPPDDASGATSSRSRREKPAAYVPSRLGSAREEQPLLGRENSSSAAPSSSRTTSSSSGERQHVDVVSVNRCFLPFKNILKLVSRTKKKEPAVGEVRAGNGGDILQDEQRTKTNQQKQQKLLLTFSAQQNVQESLVMEDKETQTTTSLSVRTPSSFQLNGGYVNYYSCSGSRKNPRIEIKVETQCSAQLMKKAMEWLAQNTGLRASYDDKKGVISIAGLQIDKRMGPVDLVASLYYPGGRPRTGVAEAQEKPDSPARFEDTIIRSIPQRCDHLLQGRPQLSPVAVNG
ncbi:unnamed protein product [Urochloa humidicola]